MTLATQPATLPVMNNVTHRPVLVLESRMSTTELPPQAPPGLQPLSMLILDGTNIVRACGSDFRSGVALLLGIAFEATKRAADLLIVFDANTHFILKPQREASEIYARLVYEHRHHVVECTGGTRADDIILAEADHNGGAVVSNDRFRDFAEIYPWVGDASRMLRYNPVRDHVYVGKWRTAVPCDLWKGVRLLEPQLRSLWRRSAFAA